MRSMKQRRPARYAYRVEATVQDVVGPRSETRAGIVWANSPAEARKRLEDAAFYSGYDISILAVRRAKDEEQLWGRKR